ncbi:MAG: response regulator [Proteobacteria bacterium]|nr:response regulator [Pseudomonadota bacterium]
MKRIIIADDSGTARMFIRRCFEIAGCRDAEFMEASHGRQVLEILESQSADIVVTDLNMPEMNGRELLRRIKEMPGSRDIPVMVVTSAANPEKVQELERMGAFAILGKPLSPSSLSPVLKPLLASGEDKS